jgi:hypothetical protein
MMTIAEGTQRSETGNGSIFGIVNGVLLFSLFRFSLSFLLSG